MILLCLCVGMGRKACIVVLCSCVTAHCLVFESVREPEDECQFVFFLSYVASLLFLHQLVPTDWVVKLSSLTLACVMASQGVSCAVWKAVSSLHWLLIVLYLGLEGCLLDVALHSAADSDYDEP